MFKAFILGIIMSLPVISMASQVNVYKLGKSTHISTLDKNLKIDSYKVGTTNHVTVRDKKTGRVTKYKVSPCGYKKTCIQTKDGLTSIKRH